MKFKSLCLVFITLLMSCQSEVSKKEKFHPMVDGRNTEYSKLEVVPIQMSEDVNLYVFQDDSYVWLSYDYPSGSYGTLDMTIESDAIKHPRNLHISAQLGEWPVGIEDSIPKIPTSKLWWNNKGWIANHLWANGIDTLSYDTPQLNIRNGEMREIQISKERFGRGEWKVKFQINSIKGKDGKFYSFAFPENESLFSIIVE